MPVDVTTPVSAIEGIGSATAALLRQVGVWTVFDLLRVRFRLICDAVRSLASETEVRAWRRMAMLLQIGALTPQWAEALVRNGIETIDELARQRVDDVDALMRNAKDQGIIPDIPTSAQIVDMLKDATVLRYTGLLVGTVVDPDGRPISQAVIRVGSSDGETDERGRFRVLRIPLGRPLALQITHPNHDPVTIERPRIATDIGIVGARSFRMKPKSTGIAEPVTLSELDGDVLPPSYLRTHEISLGENDLRNDDILVVREFADARAQLVSRFKSRRDGELIVYTVRLSLSRLPDDVRLRHQFRVSGGQLVPIHITPHEFQRYKLRLRLRKAFAGRPRPVSEEEIRAYARDVWEVLRAGGFFARLEGFGNGLLLDDRRRR